MNDGDEDGPSLPTKNSAEYRPFVRRVPEFRFWHSATKAILFAIVLTFFPVFDVPVFWPILLLYFIVLFVLTMKRQIQHMLKYRYIPFSWGKKKYSAGGEDAVLHKRTNNSAQAKTSTGPSVGRPIPGATTLRAPT